MATGGLGLGFGLRMHRVSNLFSTGREGERERERVTEREGERERASERRWEVVELFWCC